jgi:hypothetical protein
MLAQAFAKPRAYYRNERKEFFAFVAVKNCCITNPHQKKRDNMNDFRTSHI